MKMTQHLVVDRDTWIAARKVHLEEEKALTRERDRLSEARRNLPWVKVEKPYRFIGARGTCSLPELFAGRTQLIVYHFMFGADWEAGCPSCSFWADNFDRIVIHLKARDAQLVAVSRAAHETLDSYKARMGWQFDWFSDVSEFSVDFQAAFDQAELGPGETKYYNYEERVFRLTETPGISVFYRDDADTLYHTYSCYSRGLDMLNGAYHYMDLLPKGRDEIQTGNMGWLRRSDEY